MKEHRYLGTNRQCDDLTIKVGRYLGTKFLTFVACLLFTIRSLPSLSTLSRHSQNLTIHNSHWLIYCGAQRNKTTC